MTQRAVVAKLQPGRRPVNMTVRFHSATNCDSSTRDLPHGPVGCEVQDVTEIAD